MDQLAEILQNQKSTRQTSTSDRAAIVDAKPEPLVCATCGVLVDAIERPKFMADYGQKWIRLSTCEKCQEIFVKNEIQKERDDAHKLRVEKLLKASRLTPRLLSKNFGNLSPERFTATAWKLLQEYNVTRGGIMLVGQCGTGKTHAVAAIAAREISRAVWTLFVSCPELLAEIRLNFSSSQKPAQDGGVLNAAKDADLLILDDVGTEKPSEWVRETLFLIINHRYEHLKPIILTTNCALAELSEKLGDRIASRIAEMCRLIRMDGSDYRIEIRRGVK